MSRENEQGGVERLLDMQAQRLAEQAMSAEDLRIALLVRGVVRQELKESSLDHSEQQWVRLAIKREGRREKFRDAVIEKGLTVLVIGALSWVGFVLLEELRRIIASAKGGG